MTTDDKSVSADLSAFDAATIERARVAVREYMDWISDTGGDETGKLSPFAQDALVHQFAWYLSHRSHQEPDGWRLIADELPPTNGNPFLCGWWNEDHTYWWTCKAHWANGIIDGGWDGAREPIGVHPTHWRPLPAAPQSTEGK